MNKLCVVQLQLNKVAALKFAEEMCQAILLMDEDSILVQDFVASQNKFKALKPMPIRQQLILSRISTLVLPPRESFFNRVSLNYDFPSDRAIRTYVESMQKTISEAMKDAGQYTEIRVQGEVN